MSRAIRKLTLAEFLQMPESGDRSELDELRQGLAIFVAELFVKRGDRTNADKS